MSNTPVNNGRRRFLTAATSVVGGVGVVGVAVPFIGSWNPSARAKAAGAPVEVKVSKLEPGQLVRAEWRGKPVYVIRRTEKAIAELGNHEDQLRDPNSEEPQQPEYAVNQHRSIKPEYMVALGVCTHLGCTPNWLNAEQKFKCPCHGSGVRKTGINFEGPAPRPLERFRIVLADDGQIVIDKTKKYQQEKGQWSDSEAFLKV